MPDDSYPPLVINSIDLKRALDMLYANDLAGLTEFLVRAVEALVRAGAQKGFLAANTAHIVFDEVERRSPIPLVSIVEATCAEARTMGLKRLGLLGTRFTMQGKFYPDVFSREGMALVVPNSDEQAYIHEKYFSELVPGNFLDETREGMLAIIRRMKERDAIEGLVLAGTELPLLLRGSAVSGVPFLDTARIHVKAILEAAFS
ncbi:MAG: aspartate/glutamate racemase family protein [Terriglobales bacterium]